MSGVRKYRRPAVGTVYEGRPEGETAWFAFLVFSAEPGKALGVSLFLFLKEAALTAFRAADQLIVHETAHCVTNQRLNTAHPGYFMPGGTT